MSSIHRRLQTLHPNPGVGFRDPLEVHGEFELLMGYLEGIVQGLVEGKQNERLSGLWSRPLAFWLRTLGVGD